MDHNCFLLCYIAAYHLRYKLDLVFGRLVDPKLEETDPHTYTKPERIRLLMIVLCR